jgi:uncharacterized SAM-binding protein YcdF (DUF218 family)
MTGIDLPLYKTLLQFGMPLGIAVAGLLAAIFFLLRGSCRKTGLILLLCSFAWLWLWSTPLWSDFLRSRLESRYLYKPAGDYPQADAIVVLGGGVRGYAGPGIPSLDLNRAADREVFAAALYHAGKAKTIMVSGGADPVIRTGPSALAMKDFLVLLNVPDSAIRIGAGSRNTVENVSEVVKMMDMSDGHSILLVTSALHMPRAAWLFGHTKLRVIPAPADFEVTPVPFRLIRVLPDAEALENSSRAAKELIGLVFYKLSRR